MLRNILIKIYVVINEKISDEDSMFLMRIMKRRSKFLSLYDLKEFETTEEQRNELEKYLVSNLKLSFKESSTIDSIYDDYKKISEGNILDREKFEYLLISKEEYLFQYVDHLFVEDKKCIILKHHKITH